MSARQPTTGGQGSPGPPIAEPQSAWSTFAGVMMGVAALANALWGIAALVDEDRFAVDELLVGDLAMWGGALLVVALLQLVTAVLIFNRTWPGAWLGILLAGVNAIGQLAAFGAYPLWSAAILTVDALIIYGLAVHALEEE
jgi:hypothetical protein